MTPFEPSPEQQAALDRLQEWIDSRPHGYITLGGLAGTGKTTLVAHVSREWPNVSVMAFTGKAAHVLRAKGVNAQTVHSQIYITEIVCGKPRFRKRTYLEGVFCIIVDESSMLDHLLVTDLLSFGLPVLFVGDHGQLEPIGTNPRLMVNPQLRLETIHRQARDNPIIRLAAAFREGRPVPRWKDPQGRVNIVGRWDFDKLVSPDVQMICGYNKTRHVVNQRVRQMMGNDGHLVTPGEKLICLRNNRHWGLFNGQQVTVREVGCQQCETIDLEIETDDGRTLILPCLKAQFGHDLIDDFREQEVVLMDYGYCLTAHKSQGSEWPNVLVLEQIAKVWDARRWRYTVATRAREVLTYCAP
jgi:exodeoxyribonuclease-5